MEVCDDRDNDCDGTADEGAMPVLWYVDMDGDRFGDPALPPVGCAETTATTRIPAPILARSTRAPGDCASTTTAMVASTRPRTATATTRTDCNPDVPDDCGTQIGVDDDCDGSVDEAS